MIKIVAAFIIFLIISAIVVVLWQRQPRPKNSEESATGSAQSEIKQKEDFSISPPDGTVLKSQTVKLQGKTQPKSSIVIYSNDFQNVTKANDSGDFDKEISLTAGLNLIKIVVLSENLETSLEKTLSLYYSDEDLGNSLAAGSVKSIFDSLLTITTLSGEKNVRTSKSTAFDIPQEEDVKESTSEVDNIRIGDFAIATGDSSDHDSIIARKLTIIRQDKPQLLEEIAIGKIASDVRQNIFSIKNNKDSQLIEFKLGKNSSVSLNGEEAQTTDIAKDKSAIVIYTKSEGSNTVDLIYLLP